MGKAAVAGEVSEMRSRRSHRGSGDSTCGENRNATREVCPGAGRLVSGGQRRPREGRSRLGQMADGPV